jgi:hypothetical protein
MKKILLILLLFTSLTPAQLIKLGDARGAFFSVAIGPRLPLGDFSISQNIGVGVTASVSYSDNKFLPLFFYGSLGFSNFPGKLSFYRKTSYALLSSNIYEVRGGVRFFLPPLVHQEIIIMPILEGGLSFAIVEKLHQFKSGSGKADFYETLTQSGFHLGVGLSVFLMDVVTGYNFFYGTQFLYFDLKLRIPIFIKI